MCWVAAGDEAPPPPAFGSAPARLTSKELNAAMRLGEPVVTSDREATAELLLTPGDYTLIPVVQQPRVAAGGAQPFTLSAWAETPLSIVQCRSL